MLDSMSVLRVAVLPLITKLPVPLSFEQIIYWLQSVGNRYSQNAKNGDALTNHSMFSLLSCQVQNDYSQFQRQLALQAAAAPVVPLATSSASSQSVVNHGAAVPGTLVALQSKLLMD